MKIIVNSGHTLKGAGSGAIGYLNESEETRKITKSLISQLKKKGYTVVEATVDKASSQSEYLKKVVKIANSSKGELFLSIHLNAGGGRGVEAYTWKGEKLGEAVKICSRLHDLGFKNRGVKDGSGFYVIKKTTMKAILVEVCFLDNSSDVRLYESLGSEKIATAIAEAF